jgi:hypothetical protein
MQYAGNTALAAALAPGQVRDISVTVQFDWNGNGLFNHAYSDLSVLVSSVQIQEQLQGDIPQDVLLIEGYATAQLMVTLEGSIPLISPTAAQTAAFGANVQATQLFGGYNVQSPLYALQWEGVRARYFVNVPTSAGPVQIQQFFGQVASVTVNRAADTVQIECLDLSSFLQAGVIFPVWSTDGNALAAEQGVGQDPVLLNSAWCIDYICRANSFYNGPPAVGTTGTNPTNSTCGVHWTMAGSAVANVGTTVWNSIEWVTAPTGAYFDQSKMWTQGQYGLCFDGTSGVDIQTFADSAIPLQVDSAYSTLPAIGCGLWVYIPNNYVVGPHATVTINLDRSAGPSFYLQLVFDTASGGYSPVHAHLVGTGFAASSSLHSITTGAWHYVGVAVLFGASAVTCMWNFDGTEVSDSIGSGAYPSVGTKYINGFTSLIPDGLKVQHVQVWYNQYIGVGAGAQPWPRLPNTNYGVSDITLGNNWLYFLPDVNQANSWTTLQQIVNTELGVIYATETGTITFRSRTQIQAGYQSGASVGTLTVDNLLDLSYVSNWDGIRNIINYTTQAGSNGGAAQGTYEPAIAWSSPSATLFPVLANSTYTWQIPLSQTLVEVSTFTLSAAIVGVTWPPNTQGIVNGYTVCNANTGAQITSGVTVVIQAGRNGRYFTMSVTNTNSVPVLLGYVTSAPGTATPCLLVPGWPLVLNTAVANTLSDNQSKASYGWRSLDLVPSAWAQHTGAIGYVAKSVLADLRAPVPQLQNVPIVGDPRIQLGDVWTLQDSQYTGTTLIAAVSGMVRAWDKSNGLKDTLTMRIRNLPGGWMLGTADKSIMGGTHPTTILVK